MTEMLDIQSQIEIMIKFDSVEKFQELVKSRLIMMSTAVRVLTVWQF